MDWNHDGKYDWEDHAQIYNMVKSIEEVEGPGNSEGTENYTVRCGGRFSWDGTVCAFGFLAMIIMSDGSDGFISSSVALISGMYLIAKFFRGYIGNYRMESGL